MEFSTFVPKNDSLTCQLPFDTTHTVSLAIVPPTWNAMQTAVSAIARVPAPEISDHPKEFLHLSRLIRTGDCRAYILRIGFPTKLPASCGYE